MFFKIPKKHYKIGEKQAKKILDQVLTQPWTHFDSNAHLDVGESMGTKNEEMARNSMQGTLRLKTVHWNSCKVPKEAFSFGQSSDGCHFFWNVSITRTWFRSIVCNVTLCELVVDGAAVVTVRRLGTSMTSCPSETGMGELALTINALTLCWRSAAI